MDYNNTSIVIPAKNEAPGLASILPQIKQLMTGAEIIVVNDGSTDNSSKICSQYDVIEIKHPYSKGNGAAIKSGTRAAKGDILVFMDGDGQHNPHDIPNLLGKLNAGYDMVVGARTSGSQANPARKVANLIYNKLASFMTGYKIEDLTSGFRVVRRKKFLKFLYILPNGFSYPTTSTMAFFRSGYSVAYYPIKAMQRKGKSHISIVKDGVKFFTIILKIGALFSPMRLFLPISALLFATGIFYYLYTFIFYTRFTNMSALLFISSLIIFMLGIISEQISMLHYKHMGDKE